MRVVKIHMLTREEILARATGGELVTLPSGGQVKVRGLSRNEGLTLQDRDGMEARDNYVIATGMLDPIMSEEDVAHWGRIEGAAGDLVEVSRAIGRLSGMDEGAGKSGPPAS
jgi:hypothetical protein